MAIVFLTGMMGAGKSCVGAALAERLGWPFLDLDSTIEERAGKSIVRIFAEDGEAAFRRMESDALAGLPAKTPCVVATGGGAVLDAANRGTMRAKGWIVHLRVDADEALRRIGRDEGRPLLRDPDPRGRWTEIAAARAAVYADSDASFETTGRTPAAVAEAIAEWLWKGGRL